METAAEVADEVDAYKWQYITGVCHVAVQYLKLVIILVAVIYLRCCVRGKLGRPRGRQAKAPIE